MFVIEYHKVQIMNMLFGSIISVRFQKADLYMSLTMTLSKLNKSPEPWADGATGKCWQTQRGELSGHSGPNALSPTNFACS